MWEKRQVGAAIWDRAAPPRSRSTPERAVTRPIGEGVNVDTLGLGFIRSLGERSGNVATFDVLIDRDVAPRAAPRALLRLHVAAWNDDRPTGARDAVGAAGPRPRIIRGGRKQYPSVPAAITGLISVRRDGQHFT